MCYNAGHRCYGRVHMTPVDSQEKLGCQKGRNHDAFGAHQQGVKVGSYLGMEITGTREATIRVYDRARKQSPFCFAQQGETPVNRFDKLFLFILSSHLPSNLIRDEYISG